MRVPPFLKTTEVKRQPFINQWRSSASTRLLSSILVRLACGAAPKLRWQCDPRRRYRRRWERRRSTGMGSSRRLSWGCLPERWRGSHRGKSRRGIWEWDYESFVDVSKRVMVGRSRKQQEEVVREVLLSMLPPGAPAQFRKLFPPTKWAAEFNAALTVPFFHWLVGPSEVIEVEVNGTKQRSGVHIKKCRYLENSGCVGMCVNMCKLPTQDFFTNEFGLPLTMNPNFEDMSCDMVYGQPPPPFEEDPVSKQPCYSNICSLGNPNSPVCHKLQN
ncbi:hypothetical protein HPP92_020251 [Vanilla planifolia]|uniref:Beta-carotene isomerase D27-like C-terminal domain-containing protein n=1 Tax=Vanilla planifolia TaxID=51239 RepID=A0A835Q041_VANPL|nr:hypothetical protein HPP92_020251 [Vanilla planifolia]